MEKRHDKEIIQLLREMPLMKDNRDKNILYQQISSNQKRLNKPTNTKRKLLPVLGSIIAVIIVFISFALNNTTQQTSEEQIVNESLSTEDKGLAQDVEETPESEESLQRGSILLQDYKSYVLQSEEDHMNIIYAALPDQQLQYVIPISFIVTDSKNINEHYNMLETYLNEKNFDINNYLLEGVSYTIRDSNNEVEVHLPNGFSIQSSAQAYMFEKLLEAMFVPVGIERVFFFSDGSKGVELGPFGYMEEMILHEEGKVSYKLYNDQFLVPIPQEMETTIHEAISEMKNNEESFNLQSTIPSNIDFSIESYKDELKLTYKGQMDNINEQQILTMIEAILMTAKNFGFELVRFQNMPLEFIGTYNLNEAIQVPKAVNPYDVK